MNAWFPPLRARARLVLSAVLVVAGLVPLLYFAGLLVWQFATLFLTRQWVPLSLAALFTEHGLAFVPQFPASLLPEHPAAMWMLSKVHTGLIPALLGVGIGALGVMGVLSQYAVIRAQRQWNEDRVRRVRDYQSDDGQIAPVDWRREPYISDAAKKNPAQLRGRVRISGPA